MDKNANICLAKKMFKQISAELFHDCSTFDSL